MNKDVKLSQNEFTWAVSKKLLYLILDDKVSDFFVCQLVWERLFYAKEIVCNDWVSTKKTPLYWSERFFNAPQIISERPASVHLTRSIPKNYKQSLKECLNFKGYKINELYPRKTRRATAVNWLIYWAIEHKCNLNKCDKLPELSTPSHNPSKGHYGDLEIK